ncbi:glycosyltransferase [Candidatus Pelagibacter sp.]|uniref:glycosyltransferase n=1 Tax=Candidatus Pelagibacter sp. TaxID=2024849 RepID=UPI003F8614DA
MKNKFKFSVAIPTYNNSKFLNKQLEIIFNNLKKIKLKNFLEVVISDNCSNDDTVSIVKKFKNRIKHLDSLKLNYYKNNINLGYSKNFINLTKILNGEYVIFLGDDDLPGKNFYIKIYNKLRNLKSNKLFFFSINHVAKFNSFFKNLVDFSHVNTRGSCLSGVMLKVKEINLKDSNPNNLYIQSFIFNQCFLKNGFEEIDIGEKIIRNKPHKFISERFNDKMNRKVDFGFNNKIENISYFYSKSKIKFLKFIISMTYAYDWALKIKLLLIKENNLKLSNIFFKNILKTNKFYLIIIFAIIYLRYFFTTKNFFYFNCLRNCLKIYKI